jgi:hypothetical protein
LGRDPIVIKRHERPRMARLVADLLAREPFDLLQVEQIHLARLALAQRRLPLVVRAQNVESDLWAASAQHAPSPIGWLLRREARRMRAFEAEALRRADAVLALTADDAARLRQLAGRSVVVVPAPFPATLPAAPERLGGDPCVVLFGSGAWRPNRYGAAWFVDRVWPLVVASMPAAHLHLFTGTRVPPTAGLVSHRPPATPTVAFPEDAIQVVTPQVSSGVRMKILEAWARRNPVVTTPQGARGLSATARQALLIAEDPPSLARAIGRLHADSALRRQLIDEGHRALVRDHDPSEVAARLLDIYRETLIQREIRGSSGDDSVGDGSRGTKVRDAET